MSDNRKIIMNEDDIERTIRRMAFEIMENHKEFNDLIFIGIHTRGVPLCHRVVKEIENYMDINLAKGEMEIKLYQENLHQVGQKPLIGKTLIQGNVSGKKVILFDDVLFTGRTVHAAINKLFEFGMPELIELAIMIDRGWHKVPITTDYMGRYISTTLDEEIQVRFHDTDDEEGVFVKFLKEEVNK